MEPLFNQPNSTQHLMADSSCLLSDFIAKKLILEESHISNLFSLGSIFVNKKRVFIDQPLFPSDYIRVHTHPKRYEVEAIDWRNRVIFEKDNFILINKPTGVPVHATLDNCIENVSYQLSRFLGYPLFVTQRLDVAVSGLLILAKTPQFQSDFNRYLSLRRVTKHYHALTQFQPKLGIHTHFMEKSPWAPKVLSSESSPNRLQCDLEILSSIQLGNIFDSCIHLITGRTHQIRAQLSFLNCPILGDSTYGGILGDYSTRNIALHSSFLAFKDFEFALPPNWKISN